MNAPGVPGRFACSTGTRMPEKEFPTMKPSPYKGRRPSLVRNFWVYRRLVGLAFALGLMLWFIWANDATVTVAFPFGLGRWTSTTGLVILLSALFGAVLSALAMTVFFTLRRVRGAATKPDEELSAPLSEDRPPTDYAAKTGEGFADRQWS
jgi:uncharacterized integral membrane protein